MLSAPAVGQNHILRMSHFTLVNIKANECGAKTDVGENGRLGVQEHKSHHALEMVFAHAVAVVQN